MKKVFISFLLLSFFSLHVLNGQFDPWQEVAMPDNDLPEKVNDLERYQIFSYEGDLVLNELNKAPRENDQAESTALVMALPDVNGESEYFNVVYSPVMAEGLAAKFPEIRSYKGISTSTPGRTTRFTVSPRGFEAVISGNGPEVYIESIGLAEHALVYRTSDVSPDAFDVAPMPCGVELAEEIVENLEEKGEQLQKRSSGEPIALRTYRAAIAATGEWTRQSGGTVDLALARMVSSVNRINQVLESEVAIRLILINNNEQLIFTDPNTDPYVIGNEGRELIRVNTGIMNDRVGAIAYDFGHVFTGACSDVGGIASLASVCTNRKGAAVTCWYTSNLEFVSVRIAAHEMGHQMSANHTFNNCNGNEATGNAYEPGSGSTIMSYFGLCGGNNVTGNFVPNYHVASLQEIIAYMRNGNGNSCANRITTDNVTPDVTIPIEDGFYIPVETPFILDCQAEDANGDDLRYAWEQFDIGPGQRPRCQPSGDSPLFRSVSPREETFRIFPDLDLILNQQRECYELLPTISRNMNFRVTARDYNPEGGGATWDQVSFFATAEAGPFKIEYPNTRTDTLRGGKYNLITWDVANTNQDPVNCKEVDIVMYRNNNFNVPIELLSNTPNDGSAYVLFPNTQETNVRIRIKASDNIFFDISDAAHRIERTEEPDFSASLSGTSAFICLPDQKKETIMTLSLMDYNAPLVPGYRGNYPAGMVIDFERDTVYPGENLDFTIDFSNVVDEGVFEFEILLEDTAGRIETLPYIVDLESNDFSYLSLISPEAGVTGVTELPSFSWETGPQADSYSIEIATNPSFSPESIVFSETGIVGDNYTPGDLLDLNTIYFWRVRPENRCGLGPSTPIRAFSTRALICQTFDDSPELSLPRGSSKQNLTFSINSTADIVDVNVTGVEGRYDNVLNLTLSLASPEGTRVTLFDDYRCNSPLFNLGFDDEAPDIMPCPPNTGQSIKPAEPLSVLTGENAMGDWRLTVETGAFGNGGVLNTWSLEVCTNSSTAGPFYITKDTLRTKPSTTSPLFREILEVDDPDNEPSELYYIVVDPPRYGELQLNGNTLLAGDNFNQSSINGFVVDYVHGGGSENQDYFTYIVTDNGGGWLGIDTFFISVNEQNTVAVRPSKKELDWKVYPNPAGQQLNIELRGQRMEPGIIQLSDLNGRVWKEWRDVTAGKQTLYLPAMPSGIYFLEWHNAEYHLTRKLLIQQ